VDVPDDVGRHRTPRRLWATPLLRQSDRLPLFLLQHAELGLLDVFALDVGGLDLAKLLEILAQLRGLFRPEPPPAALDLVPLVHRDGRRIGGYAIRRPAGIKPRPEGGIPHRLGPEPVPAALGVVETERRVVDGGNVPHAGAEVDVGLGVEAAEFVFQPRVLPQGLDEAADGVLGRRSQLGLELVKARGWKPGFNPRSVGLEIEVGPPHQEVVGPEAVERRKPGLGRGEVALERVYVW
jgi:hypothetical protein